MEKKNLYLIGLTGNIGSGKSTVLHLLAQRGAAIIDADRLVHDLLAHDAAVIRAVVEAFGPRSAGPSGGIDRAYVAGAVFADPAALKRLEAIVHPAVGAEIDRRLAAVTAPVAVVEAIKLVEAGLHRRCDALWVVTCPPEVAIRRLVTQRGMDEAEARRRLASQAPVEPKVAVADVVIDNGGTLEDTRRQVEEAWAHIPRDRRARPIRAVFFDAWGTLFTVRASRVDRFMEVAAALDLPIRRDDAALALAQVEAETRVAGQPRIETRAEEWAMLRDAYGRILRKLELDDPGDGLVERVVAGVDYVRYTTAYSEVHGVLEALRERGVPMGIISNAAPSILEVFDHLDLARYMDPVVVSALVGAQKPDPRIFRVALERMGRPAEEILFVDDVEENLIAAEALGMVGVLLDRDEQFAATHIRRIRQLGEILPLLDRGTL